MNEVIGSTGRAGSMPPLRGASGQRGIALIMVMVMLALLSLLGMTLLNSSTADLQITGNLRRDGNAFYVADAALEFAQVNALIYSNLGASSDTVWPRPSEGVLLNDDGTLSTHRNTAYPGYNQLKIYKDPATKQEQGTANIKVKYLGTGPVPVGCGTEVDAGLGGGGFKANFYVISVIADGANSSSHTEIESEIARVVPK
jgi:hypothetical protein